MKQSKLKRLYEFLKKYKNNNSESSIEIFGDKIEKKQSIPYKTYFGDCSYYENEKNIILLPDNFELFKREFIQKIRGIKIIGNVASIAKEIFSIPNLEYLELSDLRRHTNKIKNLPKDIQNAKKLKSLAIYGTQIEKLPEELKNLPIEKLCLGNIKFQLPEWLGDLNIKFFSLIRQDEYVIHLPKSIMKWNLESLKINDIIISEEDLKIILDLIEKNLNLKHIFLQFGIINKKEPIILNINFSNHKNLISFNTGYGHLVCINTTSLLQIMNLPKIEIISSKIFIKEKKELILNTSAKKIVLRIYHNNLNLSISVEAPKAKIIAISSHDNLKKVKLKKLEEVEELNIFAVKYDKEFPVLEIENKPLTKLKTVYIAGLVFDKKTFNIIKNAKKSFRLETYITNHLHDFKKLQAKDEIIIKLFRVRNK